MARSNTGDGGRAYIDTGIGVVLTSDTQYVLRLHLYLTSRNVGDTTNDLSVSGNWSRGGVFALSGVYSGTLIWYQDITVNRVYGSTVTVSAAVSFSGVEFWGATLSVSDSYTVPARPYSAPAAPSSISVTRQSDIAHIISPQFSQTTAAPVSDAGYQTRVSTDGGATWSAWSSHVNASHSWLFGTVANRTYQVAARNQGPGGNSEFSFSAVFHTTPAAPSGATVTRNSDASHTVKWTLGAAGSREKHVVERQVDGGSWAVIASSVSASATSYTDTTTSESHQYAYRVKATRGSLSSGYATTSTIHTTPAAPTAVTASRAGNDNLVSWTDASRFETGFTVERSQDGGAFGSPVSVAAGVTSWTHTAPALGATWQYRVRADVTTPALSSAWGVSNALALPGAPNAPTSLEPTSVFDAATARTLTWRHNPVDSSSQTAYQLRWRVAGTTAWTTLAKTASNLSQWQAAADTFPNGVTVEWEVSTWGTIATGGRDGTGASPWSATAAFRTSGTPAATINVPEHGSTVHAADLTVAWGFFDPEGGVQAGWRVELLRDGATVETRQGTGSATMCALATRLPDESAWTLRVCVQDAAGLWSGWDVAEFDVSYPRPAAALVATVWDPDTGTVSVEITNPADAEHDPAVTNRVWRSIDGGARELIATGVPPSSTVTDFTPALGGVNTYVVTAYTDLGAQSESDPVDQPVQGDSVWINGGPGFSIGCRAPYGAEVTKTAGRATKELVWFDGRDYPVEFTSPDLAAGFQLSALIPADPQAASTWEQWRELGLLPGPHMWRDPDGDRVVVSIGRPSLTRPPGGALSTLTVSAERINDA